MKNLARDHADQVERLKALHDDWARKAAVE